MSWWTYINGTITVSPAGRTQSEKRYILETILAHLPKVTGSEENMNIYILQKYGYNSCSTHNEFGFFTKGMVEIQNEYILVLEGALRDREFDESFKELNKFLNRLAKRVDIRNILVSIESYEKKFIFSDSKHYRKMYENPSWVSKDKDKEPAWWEYLMWRRGANTDLPMDLEYKYYVNPENDAEYKRRKKWEESY